MVHDERERWERRLRTWRVCVCVGWDRMGVMKNRGQCKLKTMSSVKRNISKHGNNGLIPIVQEYR